MAQSKAERIAEVNAQTEKEYRWLISERARINESLKHLDVVRIAKIKTIEEEG